MGKRIIFYVLLLILSSTAVVGQSKTVNRSPKATKKSPPKEIIALRPVEERDWKEIISVEGKFKILFPKEPEKKIIENQNTVGKILVEYQIKTSFVKYSFGYADFTWSLTNNEELQKFYDNFMERLVKSGPSAVVVSKNDFYINNILGREAIIKNDDYVYMNRYILVGNRLFQLLTTTPKEIDVGQNVKEYRRKFLDSFNIVK
jgi:hypothetical protein